MEIDKTIYYTLFENTDKELYVDSITTLFDQFKRELESNMTYLNVFQSSIDTLFNSTSFSRKEKVVKEYLKTLN